MANKTQFGIMPTGQVVDAYTLSAKEMRAVILTLGGIVQKWECFGTDIVAGFDTLSDYLEDDSYQGALIGRTCNRIAHAQFSLHGKVYHLAQNDGAHHLHGGVCGFSRKVWQVVSVSETHITLTYHSPDGEENYPGNLDVFVTYTLSDEGLSIHYEAQSDADTPFAMTNHCYYNLLGYGNGDILGHTLQINANQYTETDDSLIPTGRRIDVEGTHYDFRTPKLIGDNMPPNFRGFDDNFVFFESEKHSIMGELLPCVSELSAGGLALRVYSDQPCMQVYIGNVLQGQPNMKGGLPKMPHHTICLETQPEPNAVNHGGIILRAGERYMSTTVYNIHRQG